MKKKQTFNCLMTISVLILSLVNVRAQNIKETSPILSNEEVVLRWNRVLTETIRTPGAHPSATIFPVRSYAMMHGAMFDAVNSIDGTYTPYLTDVPGTKNASIAAAAAQAAHDVLVGLYPSRTDIYDSELMLSLQGIEPNRARQGIRVGEIVAANMLAARANDGWNVTPPPYTLPTTPGNWQPTPGVTVAGFTHTPGVQPFALTSLEQFAPIPPPALTSAIYARDFNEVKEVGSATSATRTADQTLFARLWAGIGTPTTAFFAWTNVARDLSESRNLSTVERARLFALFNMAAHDALVTTFASKFHYGLWRPITAIRRADEDGNPDTTQDATWTTLIPTPPYPSYAGNMSGIGTAHSTSMMLFFGRDDIPLTVVWENGAGGTGGATRTFASFSAMAQEEADSRIYGGIHYRFDNVAGQAAGRNVANYIFQNFFRARTCVR